MPAKILLSSNISLARAVQEIIGPQLFLYGPSAVTLGQYSPVRPPRSVGKKSVFKAFDWHFILRDFVSRAIYLAKLRQNYDIILHHTALFFNWIILRKKKTEGVKGTGCTKMLFRNGMNLLLEVFLYVIKQFCINCRVSFKSITSYNNCDKKISFYLECFKTEIYHLYMFWKSVGF